MLIRPIISKVCEANGMSSLAERVNIVYSNRLKTTGAHALWTTMTITIGVPFANAAPESEFEQMVAHETAHLITRERYGYGPRPHGREWSHIMITAGYEPRRCHNVKLGKQHYCANCVCGKRMTVGKTQYRRLVNGTAIYKCRHCSRIIKKEMVVRNEN